MARDVREFFCPESSPPKPLDDRYMPADLLQAILDSGYYEYPGVDRSGLSWFGASEPAREPVPDPNRDKICTRFLDAFYHIRSFPPMLYGTLHQFLLFFFRTFIPYTNSRIPLSTASNEEQQTALEYNDGLEQRQSMQRRDANFRYQQTTGLAISDRTWRFTLDPWLASNWAHRADKMQF